MSGGAPETKFQKFHFSLAHGGKIMLLFNQKLRMLRSTERADNSD